MKAQGQGSVVVHPVSGALGAEIRGVDLSQALDETTVRRIRAALLEHLVLFFRDQRISPSHQLRFARYFGEIGEYPMVKGMDEYPEIVVVEKHEDEVTNFGGVWHSDTTYLKRPPLGSVLYAKVLPPAGGDTLFANMYLAYESLSDAMKVLLGDLKALNTAEKAEAARGREVRAQQRPGTGAVTTTAVHPVVRTHPETGRKALYVNPGHTLHFVDFSVEESAPILNFLYETQVQPEFSYRFRWTEGALAFWDNRAAQHYAVNDYHGHRRVMHRVTLVGDEPY